jgi:replicative DNA helicase
VSKAAGLERALLGALLVDPARIDELAATLKPDDFDRDTHRRLYELLLELRRGGRAIDLLLVLDEIGRRGADDYGGVAFVAQLGDNVPTTENLGYYATQVRGAAKKRRIRHAARELEHAASNGHDPEDVVAMARALSLVAGEDDWPTPQPLMAPRPPFPVDCLPKWAGDFALALSEAVQVPLDLAGVGVLSAMATAIRGRTILDVTPDWRELLTLYTITALPSGERKSPVFSALTRPIWHWLSAENDRLKADVSMNESLRRALRKRIEGLEKKYAKAADPETKLGLDAAVKEFDALPVMRVPRVIVDDVTYEKAADLLVQHGFIAVVAEESGIFDTMGGLYHGGTERLDLFLKGHDGSPHAVDRVSRPNTLIKSARMGFFLSVQRYVIEALSKQEGFMGKGILPRFLFAIPDSLVGTRRPDPEALPEALKATYGRRIQEMLAAPAMPARIRLSPQAEALRRHASAELEPRLRTDLSEMVPWASKMLGRTLRIAGVFHLFANRGHDDVLVDDLERALGLQEYFIAHAKVAHGIIAQGHVGDAERVLEWISRTHPKAVAVRDLRRGLRWRSNEQAWEAMARLIDLGWLRRVYVDTTTRGGRPHAIYVPHPSLSAVH